MANKNNNSLNIKNKILKDSCKYNKRLFPYVTNLDEFFHNLDQLVIKDKKLFKTLNDIFNKGLVKKTKKLYSLRDILYYIDSDLRFQNIRYDNTYNNDGNIIVQYIEFSYYNGNDTKYITALSFHFGGDVRVNYSNFVFLERDVDYNILYESEFNELCFEKDEFLWWENAYYSSGFINWLIRENSENFDEYSGRYYSDYPKEFVEVYESML